MTFGEILMKSIFERELAGELISTDDPEYNDILSIIKETMNLCRELNQGVHSEEENLEYLSKITGKEIDESVFFMPPFYVDYGKNITIGKGVVIQQLCTFMDRGGITIEEGVFIAPKVNLTTLNHDFNPENRSGTYAKPIVIKKNAWIGIGATILPGVTIGENAIVGAGSVVTKDVETNTIVAGNPAKYIKRIDE